jgi:sugar/nucleoside kinase (ribokinase family)
MLTGTALGTDAESGQLRALLDDPAFHNLDRTLLPDSVAHAVTPVCTIRVFPDGERQMSGRGYAQAVAPLPLSPTLLARCSVVAIDPNLGQAATQAALDAAGAGCAVVAMDFEREPDVVRACRILVTSRERLLRQQEKGTRSIRSTWPGGWWKRAARPRQSSR